MPIVRIPRVRRSPRRSPNPMPMRRRRNGPMMDAGKWVQAKAPAVRRGVTRAAEAAAPVLRGITKFGARLTGDLLHGVGTVMGSVGRSVESWGRKSNPSSRRHAPAAYITRSGAVMHPSCYFDATKTIEGQSRIGSPESIRSSWPAGVKCAKCGGKTAKEPKKNPSSRPRAQRSLRRTTVRNPLAKKSRRTRRVSTSLPRKRVMNARMALLALPAPTKVRRRRKNCGR